MTDGLASRVEDFRYAHFDNDYYERADETGDGQKLSDHDPAVLTLKTRSEGPEHDGGPGGGPRHNPGRP